MKTIIVLAVLIGSSITYHIKATEAVNQCNDHFSEKVKQSEIDPSAALRLLLISFDVCDKRYYDFWRK